MGIQNNFGAFLNCLFSASMRIYQEQFVSLFNCIEFYKIPKNFYKNFYGVLFVKILISEKKLLRLDNPMMAQFAKFLTLPQRYTLCLQSPALFPHAKNKKLACFRSKTDIFFQMEQEE